MPDQPFDPLSLESLGESVLRELISRPVHPLPPGEAFVGTGIYALYYVGDWTPYKPIADLNDPESGVFRQPIYVGKAVPTGSRKGGTEFQIEEETKVYDRLREHARTIEEVDNLELKDFRCRHLVVATVWIRLCESVAVQRYRPLWNSLIDGFGNHDPGSGRYDQKRSKWDTLHPGRSWAPKLAEPPYDQESLRKAVRGFLRDSHAEMEPEPDELA